MPGTGHFGAHKKVTDVGRIVLRLHFLLAANCAPDQLAALAAVGATSKFVLLFPFSAACTKYNTLASIAQWCPVSLAIFYCRCIVIM